jgi:hypothetical protein
LADLSFSPVTPLNRREMIDCRARICFPEWETKCCGVQKYIVFECRVPSRTPGRFRVNSGPVHKSMWAALILLATNRQKALLIFNFFR